MIDVDGMMFPGVLGRGTPDCTQCRSRMELEHAKREFDRAACTLVVCRAFMLCWRSFDKHCAGHVSAEPEAPMGRESIAQSAMIEMLIQETASRSGRCADSLGQQVRLTKHAGEPNWDAECGIVGIVESRAFRDAVRHLQGIYDVD